MRLTGGIKHTMQPSQYRRKPKIRYSRPHRDDSSNTMYTDTEKRHISAALWSTLSSKPTLGAAEQNESLRKTWGWNIPLKMCTILSTQADQKTGTQKELTVVTNTGNPLIHFENLPTKKTGIYFIPHQLGPLQTRRQ